MADVQGISDENAAKSEQDFVTVLRSLSVPLQKSFRTQGGELVAKKTPFPLDYEASRSVLTDFEGLCDELKRLENDSHRCIISGELADGVDGSCIRRTRADFGPCEHYWIMIDADDIPMPEGLSPSDSNAEKLVAEVVNHLPEAFKAVDCWYQFSGSMGIKEGIRVHLWFWLSRRLGDQEKHAWLSSCPVDPKIYNSNQIHYTAGPSFEISSSDPFPRRSGRYQAGHSVSVVTVPENLPKVVGEFRRQRLGGSKAQIGSETVFDPETGLAIDGREQLLFELSISAMFDLCVGDKVPTVDEITDRLWSLFQEKADLTHVNDRVWTRADAEEKAKARHEQKITGEFDFQAQRRNIALVPSGPSPYVTEIVSAEEGTAKLKSALDQFFTDLSEGRTPRDLIRITMGSGKTKGTIRELKEFLAIRSNQLIEVYVPRHDLIDEWVTALQGESDGTVNAQVIHVKPRTGGTLRAGSGERPFEPLCDRAEYVSDLEAKGYPVFSTACLSESAGERCEFYETCRYLGQFKMPEECENKSGNVIRIYPHAYLGLPRNQIERERLPDLSIVDENPLPSLVAGDNFKEVSLADIASQVVSGSKPNLGADLVSDILSSDGMGWLALIRYHGVNSGQLAVMRSKMDRQTVPFNKSRVTTASLPNVKGSEGIFSLLQVLREELHFKNRKHPERVVQKADSSFVIVCLAKECRITEEDPLLILDATASSQVSEKLFGPLRQTKISIHQRAFVTQVYDRTGHNTGWNQKIDGRESYDDVASLINALKGWVAHGSRPLVVSHKMLADHLREKLADDSGVAVAHFQALRGSNEYEDCDVVFITGRHSPPADAIDRQGRALFWDDEEPLQHDDVTERLPSSLVGFWMNEGENHNQMGVYVEDFSDPRLSAVYEQTRQAEVAQAIARLRLVWSRSTKRVFLLGNLPVEVPVDCVVEFNNLFPDRLERELIEKGDMPLTAKGMFKMRPDLFENANAASKALSRSILSNPKKLLRVLPEQLRATLTEVTFRAEGARLLQKHLFLPRIDSSERSVLVWKGLEIDEITAHLEQGWGKGNVRDIELRFVHEGQPEEAN